VRWGSAISTSERLEDAVSEAVETVAAELEGAKPDLVCAFVTDHHAPHFPQLAEAVEEAFPGALLFGCTAGGAIGGGVEVEHEHAISLSAGAMPGVTLTPFHLDADRNAWRKATPIPPEEDPAFLILPCPLTCPVEEVLQWMDARWPGAVKVGGLASGGMTTRGPARNSLFLGDQRLDTGAVGIALTGDVAVDTVVSQGCRPIGQPMFVTRAQKNVAYELDGEPALHALEKLHASLDPPDRALFRHSLFIGVGMREGQAQYGRGDFLVRNLVGVDPDSGALAVGAPLKTGMVVQFQLRDARTSAQDLVELLGQHEHVTPSGALLFSCVGRGRLLYGVANHDSDAFSQVMGPVPLGGFFCNGEIGPVSRRTFLHGQTSSFALFRRRAALA
jgi:small ligand-binding sensory domain FIST